MVRHTSKSIYDSSRDKIGGALDNHRFLRKRYARRLVVSGGLSRHGRRHGWGYVKRRAVMESL